MKQPLAAWCHGHTHRSSNKAIGSTRVISNQLGYRYCMGEKDPEFFPEFVVSISDKGKILTWRGNSTNRKVQEEENLTQENIQSKPPPPPPPPK